MLTSFIRVGHPTYISHHHGRGLMIGVIKAELIKDTNSVTLGSLLNKMHSDTLLRFKLSEESCGILWQDSISKL
jgi:hypothetical protein